MNQNIPMGFQRIEGQTFVGATVQIDGGVAYTKCRFVNCTIVVTGTGPIVLEDTQFENPKWMFTGPAGNVLNFLRFLYTNGQQAIVESLFEAVRTGRVQQGPIQAPPSQAPVQ